MKRFIKSVVTQPFIFPVIKHFKRGATVLCYHGVEEQIINPYVQEIHMALTEFEKQISLIKKHFEVISLDYLYELLNDNKRIDPRQIVITFDDGYLNNYTIAAPLLEAHNMAFSIFLSTNHIETRERFPMYKMLCAVYHCTTNKICLSSLNNKYDVSTLDKQIVTAAKIKNVLKTSGRELHYKIIDELSDLLPDEQWNELNEKYLSDKPMKWEKAYELSRKGVTIGSHGHDHIILHDKQSMKETIYQIKESKNTIEQYIGECKYFAFPNGTSSDINSHALRYLPEVGYKAALSMIPGNVKEGANGYMIPRLNAPKSCLSLKARLLKSVMN